MAPGLFLPSPGGRCPAGADEGSPVPRPWLPPGGSCRPQATEGVRLPHSSGASVSPYEYVVHQLQHLRRCPPQQPEDLFYQLLSALHRHFLLDSRAFSRYNSPKAYIMRQLYSFPRKICIRIKGGIKSMLSRILFNLKGGNYAFVAKFVAAWYCALLNTEFVSDLSLGQRLYATALVDSRAYLISGQISRYDLEIGVLSCLSGSISVSHYDRKIYDLFDLRTNRELICLALQLEALFFVADNQTMMDYCRVVDMVVEKKKLIERCVDRTVSNPRSFKGYSLLLDSMRHLSEDPVFQDDVLAFED